MALSAEVVRTYIAADVKYQIRTMLRNTAKIWKGAGVCLEPATGLTRPVAASLTSPQFMGFAVETVDPSAVATGTLDCTVLSQGVLVLPSTGITGATAVTDQGKTVYMSDDNTFTTTALNNVQVGKLVTLFQGLWYLAFKAFALV